MRRWLASVLVLLALLAALLVGTFARRPRAEAPGERSAPAAPSAIAAAPAPGEHGDARAAYPRAIRDPARREELRRKLLAAALAGDSDAGDGDDRPRGTPGPAPRGERRTEDLEELGRFLAQAIREDFVPMAEACARDLQQRVPDAGGETTVAFALVGDPKLGGIVEDADVVDAGAPVGDALYATCIRESLHGVYFDPPPAGGRATLRFPVTLDGTNGGIVREVDDFHLVDKRGQP